MSVHSSVRIKYTSVGKIVRTLSSSSSFMKTDCIPFIVHATRVCAHQPTYCSSHRSLVNVEPISQWFSLLLCPPRV